MSYRIALDIIACDGRGLCADLLPERIALDDWGFPIVDPAPLDPTMMASARAAVAACPVLALRLAPTTEEKVSVRTERRSALHR